MKPEKPNHADPSGISLSEDRPLPPAEEQACNYRPGGRLTGKTKTPESIRAARALVAGELPLANGLTIDEPDLLRHIDAEWPACMFWPDEAIESASEPTACVLLALGHGLEGEEEDAALDDTPSPLRSKVLAQIYEAAATEAVDRLFSLAQERGPDGYRNCRLRARLCKAVREELAELLREWDELEATA